MNSLICLCANLRWKGPGFLHLIFKVSAHCLFIFISFSVTLQAQMITKQWDKTFGGNADDNLAITVATSDGGFLLAGTSTSSSSGDKTQASLGGMDYWIVKTDSNGVKLWDKTLGTSEDDILTAAVQTSDGGYLVGGSTLAGVNGDKLDSSRGGYDYWIIKLDKDGSKLWNKTFGGGDADYLHRIMQTPDGGYLLGGTSRSEAGGDKTANSLVGEDDEPFRNWPDFWIIKIDSVGRKQWDSTVGDYYQDTELTSLLTTAEGGYLIGGNREGYWSGDYDEEIELITLDGDGKQLSLSYRGYADNSGDNLISMIQTKEGGYVMVAATGSADLVGTWIEDSNFSQVYPNEYFISAVQATNEGYFLGGKYRLVKISNAGIKLWDKTFAGDESDQLRSFIQGKNGGFLFGATSAAGISGDKTEASRGGNDYWILKTTPADNTCKASGTILREYWENLPGKKVSLIPVNSSPASTSQLTSFETSSNQADHYGARIRGYLCVPTTGDYTFFIAGDDNCELSLSSNEYTGDKVRIAHISGLDSSSAGIRQWNKYASQQSAAIFLVKGKQYYIEALHKEDSQDDHLAVGWIKPGSESIEVIPGTNLSPTMPPSIIITAPDSTIDLLPGEQLSIQVDVTRKEAIVWKVEFYIDTLKIGEDDSPPYNLSWTASKTGTYLLTARVTDAFGISATSLPLTIHVKTISDGRQQWNKTIGGNNSDNLHVAIETNDGGYLLAGQSYSSSSGDKTEEKLGCWVVKLDSTGTKLWDKAFTSNGYNNISSAIQTRDNGYLLAGESWADIGGDKTDTSRGGQDFWIIKIDAQGNKLWDKSLGGTYNEYLRSVLQTSDRSFLLVGSSQSGIGGDKTEANRGDTDCWIIKIDSTGTKLWDKTFGGNSSDGLTSAIQTSDNGYLLAGNSQSGIGVDKTDTSRGGQDFWIIKIDAQGNKLWDKCFGGSHDDGLASAIQAKGGGYLLAGSSQSGIGGDKTEANRDTLTDVSYPSSDYWIIRIDSVGNKLWDKTFGGNRFDWITSAIQTKDGSYLLAGSSQSDIGGDKSEMSKGGLAANGFPTIDYWIVKVEDNGHKQWDKTFGGKVNDWHASAIQTKDGSYLLAGYSDSGIGGDKSEESRGGDDYWIIKTTADSISLVSSLQINFQDKHSKTPAGWLKDYGLPFGEKTFGDNTYYYGWKKREDNTPVDLSIGGPFPGNGRWRPTPTDPLLATLMHMQGNHVEKFRGNPTEAYWEVAVEDGDYQVTVSVGDGTNYTGTNLESHSINIEGVPAIFHFIPQGANGATTRFKQATIKVTMSDGYLTLDANGGTNTKINYASIQPLNPASFARKGEYEKLFIQKQVRVYPNPFSDKVRIETNLKGRVAISVHDVMGISYYQAVHQLESGELVLDLSAIPMKAGIYLLKLQPADGKAELSKVLKK